MDEELLNLLKEKRPNISNSSLKTYESILRNLYIKVFGKIYGDEKLDIKLFNTEQDKILKFLQNIEYNRRKTVLSALVVITDKYEYRNLMLDDIKEYNKNEAKQAKTDAQKENWVTGDDIERKFKTFFHNAKLLYMKENKTASDYQEIQNYIILCLFSGKYIPPRRSLDYSDFKIKNFKPFFDNHMDGKELVFNTYKTHKTYGQQKVLIPIELKKILNKWIKNNPTEYLLFDIAYNKISSVKLNQRLNKIFGKKVGVNQMRKTYLSDKYSDSIETRKDLEQDFKDMGSSTLQENIYIKK